MNSPTPDPDDSHSKPRINIAPSTEKEFLFTRESIINHDFCHFLQSFAIHPESHKTDIKNLFGRVNFSFETSVSSNEIWEDAKIRNYISTLDAACPCWLFYAKPELENILPILACVAPEVFTRRQSESNYTEIAIPDDVTRPIFGRWMIITLQIGAWAEVPDRRLKKRLHEWIQMLLQPEVAEDFARNFLDGA